MTRGYVPLLLVLAALWGASFMFIKVAVEEIAPATTMGVRLFLSAVPLLVLLAAKVGVRDAVAQLRSIAREGILLGGFNAALPFFLIAWGETHVDSGVAAIANSSVPIFVALLAVRFRPSERVRGLRLFGVLLGLAGVAVLAGVRPEGGWWGAAGTLACVVAAFSYGIGALYSQGRMSETNVLVVATATTFWGTLWLLPASLVQMPDALPSWQALGSVVALALLGTVLGLLIYFHMIDTYGSARSSLVVYLLPITALFYGAFLLAEPITTSAIAGLALILAGVALGSGVVRVPRRREVAAVTPRA